MKYFRALLLLISLFSVQIFADFVYIEPKELIKDSDLIVIGTLQDVSEYTHDDIDHSEGKIEIERVIAGNVMSTEGAPLAAGDRIRIKWQNSSFIACPRVEHAGAEGIKGIWLLTIEERENVWADYPARFISLDKRSEIEKLINKGAFAKHPVKKIEVLSEAPVLEDQAAKNEPANLSPGNSAFVTLVDAKNLFSCDYAPYNALLVFITSVMLYMVLYRNRFK